MWLIFNHPISRWKRLNGLLSFNLSLAVKKVKILRLNAKTYSTFFFQVLQIYLKFWVQAFSFWMDKIWNIFVAHQIHFYSFFHFGLFLWFYLYCNSSFYIFRFLPQFSLKAFKSSYCVFDEEIKIKSNQCILST